MVLFGLNRFEPRNIPLGRWGEEWGDRRTFPEAKISGLEPVMGLKAKRKRNSVEVIVVLVRVLSRRI